MPGEEVAGPLLPAVSDARTIPPVRRWICFVSMGIWDIENRNHQLSEVNWDNKALNCSPNPDAILNLPL